MINFTLSYFLNNKLTILIPHLLDNIFKIIDLFILTNKIKPYFSITYTLFYSWYAILVELLTNYVTYAILKYMTIGEYL